MIQDQGFEENDESEIPSAPKKRGQISEYEITLLWQTFKDNNFPGGRVNGMQLSQMLRKVSEFTKDGFKISDLST